MQKSLPLDILPSSLDANARLIFVQNSKECVQQLMEYISVNTMIDKASD